MVEQNNGNEDELPDNPLLVAIASLEKWVRRLAGAGALAFCATLLVAIGLFVYQDDASDTEAKTLETIRDERSIGACKQENIQTRRTREFAKEQLVQVFTIFSRNQTSSEQIREERKEQLEVYNQFVNSSFPYRNCTRACVIAYLTPDIVDCQNPEKFPE